MDKLNIIQSKIISNENLKPLKSLWKLRDWQVVFTNGCFDILHRGHIEYLAKAASLCDVMIVGVNSDNSVKKIKGDKRPIQDEESRSLQIAALHFVDHVILFDEETPYRLIKEVNPDILVKGKDYKAKDIVGYDIVKKNGGRIITIDIVPGYSTSKIIDHIRK